MHIAPLAVEHKKTFIDLITAIESDAFFIYTSPPIKPGAFEAIFQNNNIDIFIGLNDKNVGIGYAMVVKNLQKESAHLLKIQSIGITPSHRAQGCASQLLAFIIESYKNTHKIITLEVISGNTHAINLYKKFGFTECGKIKDAFKKDGGSHDLLTFCKTL